MHRRNSRKLMLSLLFLAAMSRDVALAGPFDDGFAALERRDYATAMKLLRPLAEHGNKDAQFYLGRMYINGEGVGIDYTEAVKWFRLAAGQGDTFAQSNLGARYAQGQGVPQDHVRALMWFNLSVSSSSREDAKIAAKNRDTVAAKMTPQQIAQAQEMTRKCRDSNYKYCD
jgi:TPR repeat protein